MVDADAVPALHDGQEGDERGDNPAPADHQSHSHGRHFVLVDQRLAADSVIPADKRYQRDDQSKTIELAQESQDYR